MPTKKELEAEIERLRVENAASVGNVSNNDTVAEINKLDQIVKKNSSKGISYKWQNDHKNISLWTAINKRIGPLHPANARREMERWRKAGIQLYTERRTPEQVEAFKKTKEYQEYHKKHLEERQRRHRMTGTGQMAKFAEQIAKETARAVSGVGNR